jgi:hypothetical protein
MSRCAHDVTQVPPLQLQLLATKAGTRQIKFTNRTPSLYTRTASRGGYRAAEENPGAKPYRDHEDDADDEPLVGGLRVAEEVAVDEPQRHRGRPRGRR